jgi:hypothetical protein
MKIKRAFYLVDTYPIKIIQDLNITQDHVLFDGEKLQIYVEQYEDKKINQTLKRFYYQQCKALVEKMKCVTWSI